MQAAGNKPVKIRYELSLDFLLSSVPGLMFFLSTSMHLFRQVVCHEYVANWLGLRSEFIQLSLC